MWNNENWAISLVSRGGSAEGGTAQVERDKGESAQGVSAQFHIELEHKGSSSKPNNALDKYLTD
jgi:hypothetical protein